MKKIREVAARLLLVLAMAAATVPALAATMQARDSAGSVVTLSDKPCVSPAVLAEILRLNTLLAGRAVAAAADLHEGSLTYKGKQYTTCWVVVENQVVVVDDGGQPDSIFTVPTQHFRPIEGI